MIRLDMKKWDRAEHFRFFNRLDHPNYSLCAPIDVTGLWSFRQKMKNGNRIIRLSDMIYYAATKAANSIDEMRMRIVDGVPVIFKRIDMGFTHIPDGLTLHANCVASYDPQFSKTEQAINKARQESDHNPTLSPEGAEGQNLFYFSIMPDIPFTTATNPWGNPEEDSVPRILFGKISEKEDKREMPVSVEALHSFVDGLHMGQFYKRMQEICDNPQQHFNS